MTEHLKLTFCSYRRLSEADISIMCQQSHICDNECTMCQTAAIDCHESCSKVISAILVFSLTCHLLAASQPTLVLNMAGIVRRPKQRRQAAPRGGHMADDVAAMDFDAYEEAGNQPMVRTLCSQNINLLTTRAYTQTDRLVQHACRHTCQWAE